MQKLKLLIIDDSPDHASRIATIAQNVGFEAQVANDAKDFQDRYRAFRPDLIVMEIVLKDMDGLELIMWLQDQQSTAHILIYTGYNLYYARMAELMIRARGEMTADVLYKLVDDESLARTLDVIQVTVRNTRLPRPARRRIEFGRTVLAAGGL